MLATAAATVVCACSPSSSGNDTPTGPSDGAADAVIFSCTQTSNSLCTEELAPESAKASEQQVCSAQMGTFATGPCSTVGVFGCCQKSVITQCYYSSFEASIGKQTCTSPGIWNAAGDAGADAQAPVRPQSFVGTWARTGSEAVKCGTAPPTMMMLGGSVVIALGIVGSGNITLTETNGCVFVFSVSGNVASVIGGQTCVVTNDAGVTDTIHAGTHTLTLSSSGTTITSVDSNTAQKSNSPNSCTITANATLNKL